MVENRKYNQEEINFVLARALADWKPDTIAKAFKRHFAQYWSDRNFTKKQVNYIKGSYRAPWGEVKPYSGPIPQFSPSPSPESQPLQTPDTESVEPNDAIPNEHQDSMVFHHGQRADSGTNQLSDDIGSNQTRQEEFDVMSEFFGQEDETPRNFNNLNVAHGSCLTNNPTMAAPTRVSAQFPAYNSSTLGLQQVPGPIGAQNNNKMNNNAGLSMNQFHHHHQQQPGMTGGWNNDNNTGGPGGQILLNVGTQFDQIPPPPGFHDAIGQPNGGQSVAHSNQGSVSFTSSPLFNNAFNPVGAQQPAFNDHGMNNNIGPGIANVGAPSSGAMPNMPMPMPMQNLPMQNMSMGMNMPMNMPNLQNMPMQNMPVVSNIDQNDHRSLRPATPLGCTRHAAVHTDDPLGLWYRDTHDGCQILLDHRHNFDGGIHFSDELAVSRTLLAMVRQERIGFLLGIRAAAAALLRHPESHDSTFWHDATDVARDSLNGDGLGGLRMSTPRPEDLERSRRPLAELPIKQHYEPFSRQVVHYDMSAPPGGEQQQQQQQQQSATFQQFQQNQHNFGPVGMPRNHGPSEMRTQNARGFFGNVGSPSNKENNPISQGMQFGNN